MRLIFDGEDERQCIELFAVAAAIVIAAPVRLFEARRFVDSCCRVAVAHLQMNSRGAVFLRIVDKMGKERAANPLALGFRTDG